MSFGHYYDTLRSKQQQLTMVQVKLLQNKVSNLETCENVTKMKMNQFAIGLHIL
jgi:hypothetical protein